MQHGAGRDESSDLRESSEADTAADGGRHPTRQFYSMLRSVTKIETAILMLTFKMCDAIYTLRVSSVLLSEVELRVASREGLSHD